MMGTKVHNNYESLITFTRASGGHALRPVSYGDELVANGGFDTDSGWVKSTAPATTIASGEATVGGTGGNGYIYQDAGLTVGTLYQISFDVTSAHSSSLTFLKGSDFGSTSSSYKALGLLTTGTHAVNFVATSEFIGLTVGGGNSAVIVIDNVSVKEVTFDESDGSLTLFEHPDNIPRVEYDADGNRLGLLVEESRTNLTTISEPTFSQLSNSSNVSDGDFGNSLGLSNGIAFGDNSATRFAYRSATVSSGQDYVVSVFVKMDDGSTPNVGTNVSSGDFGLVIGSSLVTSASNISVTAMSDNVFRVSGTRTTSSTDSNHGVIKYTGQSTKGFTVTGFQIEQASFPTSYIKTTGSTATRSADVASLPVADFGFNASEGSVVIESQHFTTESSVSAAGFALDDGSSSNRMYYYQNKAQWIVSVSGTTTVSIDDSDPAESTLTKAGVTYKENDFASNIDGSLVGSDTSSGVPTVTTLHVGRSSAGTALNGHIKSIKYYPRRLTNAQLQDLTS